MPNKYVSAIERIKSIIKKKGVTVIIDFDENSTLSLMGSMYSYEPKSKILEIVAPELGKVNKQLLLKLIKEHWNEVGLLVKQTTSDKLDSYNDYTSNNTDEKTLKFFSGILTANDYSALKMSLFLRSLSEKGKNVYNYKIDIRDRYKERGANIANLCTAGYFEEFMKLYLKIPKEEFFEYYELVVGVKARALFVHSKMNGKEIEKEVNKKVDQAAKYHLGYFRVHGRGKTNVAAIDKFVKSRTGREDYRITKVYDDPKLVAVEYKVEVELK